MDDITSAIIQYVSGTANEGFCEKEAFTVIR